MLAGAWNSPQSNCVGVWAPAHVLEFQHLHHDGSSQGSILGLVSDNIGGAAFNVQLFRIEDVGLREWLDGDRSHGNPGLYAASRIPHTDLSKPTEALPAQLKGSLEEIGHGCVWKKLGTVDYVSFRSVA